MSHTTGVIYVATGDRYIREAEQSARSLRRVCPDLPITLIADKPVESPLFDQVLILPNPGYRSADKIEGIRMSPYEHTLFLDSDTYVVGDITTVFTLLDRFDIAAAHDIRIESQPAPGMPDCFPEYNSGVVVCKKSPRLADLLARWADDYQARLETWDGEGRLNEQPSFRRALFDSSARIATLPPEYSCRPNTGRLFAAVKILHERGDEAYLQRIANILNAQIGKRVHFIRQEPRRMIGMRRRIKGPSKRGKPRPQVIWILSHNRKPNRVRELKISFEKRGYWGTVRFIIQKIAARLGLARHSEP
jgi:hypothetical protein